MNQRKIWIDWAKVLSIFAIIWGHCFPEGMSGFIYAFNVPVFFIISGYLCKREKSFGICFDKALHNLIIPYFILAAIKVAGPIIKHIGDGEWLWSVLAVAGGFHSLHGASGCSNLWFVYSLVIIKFIFQLSRPRFDFIFIGLFFLGAIIYNKDQNLEWRWAVTNVLLAYPFFIIGNLLRGSNLPQQALSFAKSHKATALASAAVLFAATYFIGEFNGQADMYMGRYGNNILLFVVGSLLGSSAVFITSFLLDSYSNKFCYVISSGTIVMLVFHRELLHPLLKEITKLDLNSLFATNSLIFVSAAAVTVTFYPILLIVKRFFPIVLGRR